MTIEKQWAQALAEQVKGNTMSAAKNSTDIGDIRDRLTRMEAREEYAKRQSDGLVAWKEKIDEHASPSQLKQLVDDMRDLKALAVQLRLMLALILFVATPALSAFMAWMFTPKKTPPPRKPAAIHRPAQPLK